MTVYTFPESEVPQMSNKVPSRMFFCFYHFHDCVHVHAEGGGWVCIEAALFADENDRRFGVNFFLAPPSLDTAFISAR